jgi:hypothetical protein
MNQNFVDETDSALVTTRVNCDTHQGPCLSSDGSFLQNIIFSGKFAHSSSIVPESNGAVVFAGSYQNWPLNCNINS